MLFQTKKIKYIEWGPTENSELCDWKSINWEKTKKSFLLSWKHPIFQGEGDENHQNLGHLLNRTGPISNEYDSRRDRFDCESSRSKNDR